MRTLAQRMDSGTATLYRHFTGRAELIAHVVDAVVGEAEFDDAALREMPWRQACEAMAISMFDVFRRHPHVAPLMVEHIPLGPNAMAQRNRGIGVLLAAGFPPQLAVQAWATLARYVLGLASQLTGAGSSPERPAIWPTIDLESFPAILAVAEYLPVPLEREFAFGLQLLLAGLDQISRN